MANNVRVVIVDDSVLFREYLSRVLSKVQNFDIAGVFASPRDAEQRIPLLRPDVLAVDMEMPGMRGDEFLRRVLPKNPAVKAIVISSISSNVFNAMQAGAVDFVAKPGSRPGFDNDTFEREIVSKINVAAAAKSVARRIPAAPPSPLTAQARNLSKVSPDNIIAIGASTGGTEAIVAIARDFPADVPGTIIVQHMPPVFTGMFADRLDKLSGATVREAKNGDRLNRGTILIAPGGDEQLRVMSDGKGYFVRLTPGEKVSGHCPSVDVMFESVAKCAGKNAVGVILTGMGSDGARGLLKMRNAGAYTVGQDAETCVVYGMPRVSWEMGAVVDQRPLTAIAETVLRRFRK